MQVRPETLPCSRFSIALEDVGLHAVRWGRPGGGQDPPIVFLHEALGSVSRWRGFPQALLARLGRSGMAFDRQGHGRSPPLSVPRGTDYLHREATRVLPAVLAEAGIRRPVLYGHSDGATIALLHAAAFPDAVSALVVEAPHVIVEPETTRGIAAAREAFAKPALLHRLARHHGAKTQALLEAWSDLWLSSDFAAWSIVDEMSRIMAPLLMIQGVDDRYGTRRQLDLIAERVRGPVSLALLQGCGHAPHHEAEPTVQRLAGDFLSRL